MARSREHGGIQPGWKWGPFTARIPFIHTRFSAPELVQGIIIASATGFALVPIMTNFFGLTFEEAIAASLMSSIAITMSWLLLGEPYAPGWATPALPFALAFVVFGNIDTPTERWHAMAALCINLSAICLVFGVTGLGKLVMQYVPNALKAGIILGASLAAVRSVIGFSTDEFQETNFAAQPITTSIAIAICLITTFSIPFQKLAIRFRPLALVASLGLLPGFLVAAMVGPFVGEVSYDIEWGILIPPITSLWEKASPFYIGWPSFTMFLQCLPLAFICYIVIFGDLITGNQLIKEAQLERPDETIEINTTRSHLALSIRNAFIALMAPFFPTQGVLWTGVQVVILKRWREGRQVMDSLFDGISAYYIFALPIVFFILPLVTGLRPLMGIALDLTLALTAFACAYVAISMTRNHTEQGVVVITGASLALFPPLEGLLIGLGACLLLIGYEGPDKEVDTT